MPLNNISQDFIKAATCAPDNNLNSRIPDGSSSHTFTQKFSRQTTVECKAGYTTLFVCTPTLPYPVYYTSYIASGGGNPVTAGFYAGLNGFGSEYVETKTEFPQYFAGGGPAGVDNTTQIAAGRVSALSAEMACVNNTYNRYGTIQVFKTPIQMVSAPEFTVGGVITPSTLSFTGLLSTISDAVTSGAYMAPVGDGAYAVSMSRNGGSGDFEFTPLLDNAYYQDGMPSKVGQFEMLVKGVPVLFDNHFDSIVFKVIVPANTISQSFILKNWVSVEWETIYGSFLHGISQPSPPRDPNAFKLYGNIQDNLPVAVPSRDNPDFWKSVVSMVKPLSGMASLIPGPIGGIASGVHALSSVLKPASITGGNKKKSSAPKPPKRTQKSAPRKKQPKGGGKKKKK